VTSGIVGQKRNDMVNWQVYWKWFRNAGEPWPVSGWLTNNTRFLGLRAGTRLWLFICGEAWGVVDSPSAYQTYLAEILRVDKIGSNPNYDPDKPPGKDNLRFEIDGDHYVEIDPPLLVEDIIFPGGRDLSVHVGMRLQTPREMEYFTVNALEARLKKERPDQYRRLTEWPS